MPGVTFIETLRRNWRQGIYWGLSMAVLGYYILVIIQDVDMLKQYASMMESMPPALIQIFGVSDVAEIGTPNGFLSFGFFGYALLMLAIFAVMAGMNITANDEDAGIMDMVLSTPVPRWQIIVEKFAAYTLISVLIIIISYIGLALGMQSSALEVNSTRVLESTINILPSMLLITASTLFISVIVRRKSTALAIAAVFVVGSYFINFLGAAASGTLADSLKVISFFTYYDNQTVMSNGLNAGNIGLLLILTIAALVASLWVYQRRDVGV